MPNRWVLANLVLTVSLLGTLSGCKDNDDGSSQTAPSITTQPQSQVVTAPATATFTVAATGNPAPTYQWNLNGTAITGATSASYTTPATSAAFNGYSYTCTVTNAAKAVTSAAGVLTVDYTPAFSAQPLAQTVTVPATATFTVTASGNPAPTFQWNLNGNAIPGATSASYTTPATTMADNGDSFTCTITNAVQAVTSSPVLLTVDYGPAFTAQPQPQSVTAPATATFSVTASGDPGPSYQWNLNGTAIPGATSASYTTPPTTVGESGESFTCTLTNAVSSLTSSPAVLTVTAAAPTATIYWVTEEAATTLSRCGADGNNLVNGWLTDTKGNPWGVAVGGNYVYYSSLSGYIGRVGTDGSGQNDAWLDLTSFSAAPFGIAVDANYIYWVDVTNNCVGKANILDGSLPTGQAALQPFLPATSPVAIAVNGTTLFWTENGGPGEAPGHISTANLDGTNLTSHIVTYPSYAIYGVAVDATYLYWMGLDGTVGRSLLDGTSPNLSFFSLGTAAGSGGRAIAVGNGLIYWGSSQDLGTANLDGTHLGVGAFGANAGAFYTGIAIAP